LDVVTVGPSEAGADPEFFSMGVSPSKKKSIIDNDNDLFAQTQ
jgi:hypothetical protein